MGRISFGRGWLLGRRRRAISGGDGSINRLERGHVMRWRVDPHDMGM